MRALVLKNSSDWKAERPDRDIPGATIITEESLSSRTRFSDGVTRLFDELEKRSVAQGSESETAESATAAAPSEPPNLREFISALLEIEVTVCRMIDRLTQLEREDR